MLFLLHRVPEHLLLWGWPAQDSVSVVATRTPLPWCAHQYLASWSPLATRSAGDCPCVRSVSASRVRRGQVPWRLASCAVRMCKQQR